MGRALTRLAAELYSTDTHFVMELVQVGDRLGRGAGMLKYKRFAHLHGC